MGLAVNRTKHHRRLVRRLSPRVASLRDELQGACARTDAARSAHEDARRAAFCACESCSATQRSQSFSDRRYSQIRAEETREAWELCKSAESRLSCELHRLENVAAFAAEAVRYSLLRHRDPVAWRNAL